MPFVTAGRIRLYYEEEGCGQVLLFISGLGADHGFWAPVVRLLRDQYRCITFDNRGIGQSSRPRRGYTIPDLTRDTLGLIRALSLSRVNILGMALGGMVAQRIAADRPELVTSLISVGSMARPDVRLLHVLNSRKLMQRRMTRYEYFWALCAWMFGPVALSRSGFVETFARRAADNPHPQSLYAFDQLVNGLAQFDSRALLSKIQAPTLVMVGDQDILTPLSLSQVLAEGIPKAELVVLPGLGHFCALEDPEAFASHVAGFLARVSDG